MGVERRKKRRTHEADDDLVPEKEKIVCFILRNLSFLDE